MRIKSETFLSYIMTIFVISSSQIVTSCADVNCLEPGYNIAPIATDYFIGTAFAIEENYWVTAAHLVRDQTSIQIKVADGWVTAIIADINWERDQAALYIPDITVEKPVPTCKPMWGEHVCGCGYELNEISGIEILGCECGTILTLNGKRSEWVKAPQIVAHVAGNHGWSGGPLIGRNDCAVGVMVGGQNTSKYVWGTQIK
jgi:hypothetical protein